MVDEIESSLKYVLTSSNERKLTLVTHPYVHAYLTKGWIRSMKSQWGRKYHVKLTVKASEKYSLLDFKFFHANGDEIAM